jgi:hypothetical protein
MRIKLSYFKLNNPLGKGEWNGDWSDNSDKWNDDIKDLFKFGERKDDGNFILVMMILFNISQMLLFVFHINYFYQKQLKLKKIYKLN